MLNRTAALARVAAHRAFPRTSFRLIHKRTIHDEIEIKLLPLLVNKACDAVDVGANVGRYTKPLSRLARHVHAFEPHPRLCRMLKASLPRNVTLYQLALSDEESFATLHVPLVAGQEDEGIAHLSGPRPTETCLSLRVETSTLDRFAHLDIRFLKIDVEGHESQVLAGSRALIEARRPVVIVESEDRHSAGSPDQISSFFAQREYDGFFVLERRLRDISAFRPSMQDPTVLEASPPGAARQSIPYVNNFVFLPRERAQADFKSQAESLLAR